MTIKPNKTKKFIVLGIMLGAFMILSGVVYAAFSDRGKILGSSFSVGSADIKLLTDLAGGTIATNLTDELLGPAFSGVFPGWTKDYALKLFNNATGKLQILSNSNYSTANDPDDLRSYISVEPFLWNDTNGDGLAQEAELGTSLGVKTIIKWKTEGFDLGTVEKGQVKGVVLRFSSPSMPETKQGKNAIYDFEFESVVLE